MSRFLNSYNDFESTMNRALEFIKSGAEPPDYVFNNKFKYIRVVDYNRHCSNAFIEAILSLCRHAPTEKFWLVSLDPHPVDHYYKYFEKFGIVEFSCDESVDSVIEGWWRSPGENEVDALQFTNTIFALFSMDDDWCVWGDRDFDTMFIAFQDEAKLELFLKRLADQGVSWVQTLEETLDGILSVSFRGKGLPEDFKAAFIANYDVGA